MRKISSDERQFSQRKRVFQAGEVTASLTAASGGGGVVERRGEMEIDFP